ncbi:AraC family transcriptional regulator [Lentzea sp. PSKA42]|uniref:AraC family transcriptional regulator n=1 Tax=Lentzea indica TaxID=2604800 RepID=A0ABX1FFI6_9PSEU|nr:helix-turn-helix domain-containing protein [Lentzea indica]NKE57726.1 AraC family transcriptional regulator [Lentzea indica]
MTDLAAAHEVLSAAYGRIRLDGGRDRSLMRMTSRMFGRVRFDRVGGRIGFKATAEPLHNYVFGYVESGRVRHSSDGEDRVWLPGDVFLSAPPDRPLVAAIEDPEASAIVLSQAVVDEVADNVRFEGCRPISPRAAAAWRSTCLHLRDEVLPLFEEHPLVVANATRLLVATTLAAFPNNTLNEAVADRRDAHPQTVRRAIAFIEDNAAKDVTAADIAHAAHVSIRAIQLAFRRHLDMTPMAYLRRVRLSCADADLRTANGSVTAIAARWGYARPGVFAAHYRAAYGVLPSQTLRSG